MKAFLSPEWKAKMTVGVSDPSFEYRTAYANAATFLVLILADKVLPFKVINLGAGVKLITRKVDTCPKCHGTGKI